MGADLYLSSVFDAQNKKYKTKFETAVKIRDDKNSSPEEKEAAQKKISKYYDKMYEKGYFRDSYNNSSLFWMIGLSWWSDVGKLLDQYGFVMNPSDYSEAEMIEAKAKLKKRYDPMQVVLEVKKMVEKRPVTMRRVKAALKKNKEVSENPQEILEYFEAKRQRLLALLDESIRLNEPIYFSI